MAVPENLQEKVDQFFAKTGEEIGRLETKRKASTMVMSGASEISRLVSNPHEAQKVLKALIDLAGKITTIE